MAFITNGTTNQTVTYPEALKKLTDAGWVVISEGPSGAQLKGPKVMTGQNKVCLILGLVLLIFWGIGLLLLLLVFLQHVLLQKQPAHFLSRDEPRLP